MPIYGQNWAIHSRLSLLLLLKINKRTNKKYLCDSNFEIHLYCLVTSMKYVF